jgi:hypothetical protein
MSIQRHDLRTKTGAKYGKANVSYPYGDLRFPRIVESRTVTKGPNNPAIPFLTPHRDQASYPGAVLIEQASDPGDDTEKNVTETYEVLPGPWTVEVDEIQDTGVPILVGRRKVAAPDDYQEGEVVPPVVDVQGIGVAVNGIATVTLAANHDLPPRAWVTFAGTNSVPTLDGPQRIVGVPAENQVQIAAPVTQAGGMAGNMRGTNRIIREMKPTSNVSILMKVESMIAVPDVTVFNEDGAEGHMPAVVCVKEYSFPDYLREIVFYNDKAISNTDGPDFSVSYTGGGTVTLPMQNGYRGQCRARRLRLFSMGPLDAETLAAYPPTFVLPSSGTFVVESESFSLAANSSGGSSSSTSFTFKAGNIPPVLTGGASGPGATRGGEGAQARCFVDLVPSTPTRFYQGDTITLLEQPQKLGAALWQTIVWLIEVPYTTGLPPGDFSYPAQPFSFPHGSSIAPVAPVGVPAGAGSFSVSPSLPSGLSLNGSTGALSGTPGSTNLMTIYTVSGAASGGAALTAYFFMEIT